MMTKNCNSTSLSPEDRLVEALDDFMSSGCDLSVVNNWDRVVVQAYLESRGFAVYDYESLDTLREAVRLDLDDDIL